MEEVMEEAVEAVELDQVLEARPIAAVITIMDSCRGFCNQHAVSWTLGCWHCQERPLAFFTPLLR